MVTSESHRLEPSSTTTTAVPPEATVIDLTASPPLDPVRIKIKIKARQHQNDEALPPRKKARLGGSSIVAVVDDAPRLQQSQSWPPQQQQQQQQQQATPVAYAVQTQAQATTVLPPPSGMLAPSWPGDDAPARTDLQRPAQPYHNGVQNHQPAPPAPPQLPLHTPRKRGRPRRDATRVDATRVDEPLAPAVPSRSMLPVSQQQPPFVTLLQDRSVHNLRCRARAEEWSRGADLDDSDAEDDDAQDDAQKEGQEEWLGLKHRPYLRYADRRRIAAGACRFVPPSNAVYHVDFTEPEIFQLHQQWQAHLSAGVPDHQVLAKIKLAKRKFKDIVAFVDDTKADRERRPLPNDDETIPPGQVLLLAVDKDDYRGDALRAAQVSTLLFSRELSGARGVGGLRGVHDFKNEFRALREDDLELAECYDGGAGDIVTLTWITDDTFICGTTTHSDNDNQQYNKPGNLMLGYPGTVQSIPDHRIPRPHIVLRPDATEEQRRAADDTHRSQSRWLYTSVVSTHYSHQLDLAFSSSFDRTVKVWKVGRQPDTPAHMDLLGTWPHDGRVNFVVASKHPSCMVATAADVPSNAVRVYRINRDNVSESPYTEFSCSRVLDALGNPINTDKWAYFPATMQWGQSPGAEHLLLVGYSPRAMAGAREEDIPEDKRNTGEICLWDCLTNTRVHITTASTQNVFEVVWNPILPSFLVVTSPGGNLLDLKSTPGTQIRMFQPVFHPATRTLESFTEFKCLDCPARDINELAIRPNSGPKQLHCYVAAASTDGCVYIWDSAHGDTPIHVLQHGPTMVDLQGIDGSQGYDDNGVKFMAWGSTPDRLYTGSSDGCVKVWNIRQSPVSAKGRRAETLVRDILQAKGAVSCGAFSPDFRKLAIGDASGQVHILTLDGRPSVPKESLQSCLITIPGRTKKVRRPQRVIPHAEAEEDSPEGQERGTDVARTLVASSQIAILPRPIGAVQGPNYAALGLFCPSAHLNNGPDKPLLPEFAFGRRHNLVTDELRSSQPGGGELRLRRMGRAKWTDETEALHERNTADVVADFSLLALDEDVRAELARDGVDLEQESDLYEFAYEEE